MYNCIALSAGHGVNENNGGADGLFNEVTENRKQLKLLKTMFNIVGIDVVDCTCDYGNSTQLLKNCVENHNIVKNALNIQLHYNAGGGNGCEICLYDNDLNKNRTKIAYDLLNNLEKSLLFKNRGVKIRPDLYFLKATKNESILIETCFCDSDIDVNKHDVILECAVIVKTILNSGMVVVNE